MSNILSNFSIGQCAQIGCVISIFLCFKTHDKTKIKKLWI